MLGVRLNKSLNIRTERSNVMKLLSIYNLLGALSLPKLHYIDSFGRYWIAINRSKDLESLNTYYGYAAGTRTYQHNYCGLYRNIFGIWCKDYIYYGTNTELPRGFL
jgi:hypothetical protein